MTWRSTRLKYLASVPITNGLGEAAQENDPSWPRYIRTTDIASARHLHADRRVSLPPETARPSMVQTNDLLMCAAGSLGKVYLHGGSDPACYAGYLVRFRPRLDLVDPRFIAYWAESQPFLDKIAVGAVRSTIDNFSAGKYRQMQLVIPALEEQRRIVEFLDGETARMDRLIGLRGRTTTLAVERAEALLGRMFLNPDWRPVRLKHILHRGICYGVLVPRFVPVGGVGFIRVNDLAHLEQRADDLVQIEAALSAEYSRTVVREGDLLIAVVGSVGNATVVPGSAAGSNLARAVARVQVRHGVDVQVLKAWTMTKDYKRQVKLATGSDTAQPTLNVGDLSNFSLSVPTSSEEWRAASAESEFVIEERDRWASLATDHLRLLAERRNALVTAAVTGQLDVTTAGGVVA